MFSTYDLPTYYIRVYRVLTLNKRIFAVDQIVADYNNITPLRLLTCYTHYTLLVTQRLKY